MEELRGSSTFSFIAWRRPTTDSVTGRLVSACVHVLLLSRLEVGEIWQGIKVHGYQQRLEAWAEIFTCVTARQNSGISVWQVPPLHINII